MNDLVHKFASVLSFSSRIPIKLKREADYSNIDIFLPIIGLFAAITFTISILISMLLFKNIYIACICSIFNQYWLFNLFHLDGLLDSADAFGTFGDVEKRRTVLKDPRIGSYAFFVGFIVLSIKLFAYIELFQNNLAFAFAILFMALVSSRFSAILVSIASDPYSQTGLGQALKSVSKTRATIGYGIAIVPAAILGGSQFGVIGAMLIVIAGGLCAIAVGFAIGHWYGKHMGGYSGDSCGASIEICEVLVLLVGLIVNSFTRI